jgi:hypothetical protein
MILVGQYDSPFVRRVAVTMNVYAMAFERQVLSVFSDFDAMLVINPLGKVRRGLCAWPRCSTEPRRLKCRRDSPNCWMNRGAQVTACIRAFKARPIHVASDIGDGIDRGSEGLV